MQYRIFSITFLTFLLLGCEVKPKPVIREHVIVEVAKAIKAHERQNRPILTKMGVAKNREIVISHLFDYFETNVWCEYRRLTKIEKEQMFVARLRDYPLLRSQISKIMDRDIAKNGFGLYLSGEGWTSIPQNQEALLVFKEYLRMFDTAPCWDR